MCDSRTRCTTVRAQGLRGLTLWFYDVGQLMVSSDELADYAGTSLKRLQELAERVISGSDFQTNVYATFNRGRREIVVPSTALDRVAKNLHRSFTRELPYKPPPHVHGFVKGKSTFTNAAEHLGQACVLRVDLSEFFPSISASRVYMALCTLGLEPEAAELCIQIATIDDRLPIGLATSPILSNMVFERTDDRLVEYCAVNGLKFTRYVDDMTFSGDVSDQHLAEIDGLLSEFGWTVNRRKTAFMRRGGPQYVTGLYVGCSDRPRIPRRVKRQMRRVCFLIKTVGYEQYMDEFGGNEACMIPNRLYGWARHIAAIEPDVGYPMLQLLSTHVPEDHPHSLERPWLRGRKISDLGDLLP